jgi:AcrR family transcriptional regulator
MWAMSTSGAPKAQAAARAYHHGNLRAALVAQGLAALEDSERAGVSLRELARRVGVSPNAAYRHFADKDALLAARAGDVFGRWGAAAAAAQAAPGRPGEQLRAQGRAYVRFARENPALFKLMFGTFAGSNRSEELTQAGALTFEGLREGVAKAARLSRDDERVAVGTLYAWSVVHGLSHLILDGQLEEFGDLDAMTDAVLTFASTAGGQR